MEYYSAIKRNKYESVVVKQMPVIQNKVSQKKKKYHTLTHIMESRKIVLMNLFTDRNEDADIETGLVDTVRGRKE